MNLCDVCGEEIELGKEVDIPGIGIMHMESDDTCMTDGERRFREECAKLDEIRNRFSRNGYGTPDDHVWLIDKLQAEWEMTPWWRLRHKSD